MHHSSEPETVTVTRELIVMGRMTRIFHRFGGGQVVDNFYSQDSEGNVYLHGGLNHTYPFEIVYEPPIKMVAPPLTLDKTWTTDGIHCFDLDGNLASTPPFDYPVRVFTDGRGSGAVVLGAPREPRDDVTMRRWSL